MTGRSRRPTGSRPAAAGCWRSGVGNALGNPSSQQRLRQISGPQVVRDAGLADMDSLNDVDVALVTDFDDLAAFLRGVVLQLCSPSLTIQKLAQTPDSAAYDPAQGWDMTVTPTVPGGTGFDWILPNDARRPRRRPSARTPTGSPSSSGNRYHRRPGLGGRRSRRRSRPGYTAGRPGPDNDFVVRVPGRGGRGAHGLPASSTWRTRTTRPSTSTRSGRRSAPARSTTPSTTHPAIALSKVNAPTEVRGDLDPPATVTSDFVVTNPGNTPLANVSVTDDNCGAAEPVPATR